MFKEDETQYCPMCKEWAIKYEQLKQDNEELQEELKDVIKDNWDTIGQLKKENEISIKTLKYRQDEYVKLNKKLCKIKARIVLENADDVLLDLMEIIEE